MSTNATTEGLNKVRGVVEMNAAQRETCEWKEWRWQVKTCAACHGTGVRYCCGNRDAEMTCESCKGAGRTRELVAQPKAVAS